MKRLLSIILCVTMLFGMNTIAFAASDVKIKVNGELLSDAQAVLKDGSTLLPVRSVSTALGGEVVWDNATKTASIDKDGTLVTIAIGEKAISVNGTKQSISTPAQIISGRTYVPLRALGEALECDITWVNETKTVEISQVDPAEYKAWYEVGDNGVLYINTNINSNKWGGWTMLIIKHMINKNNPQNYECSNEWGTGIVRNPHSSALSYPWSDEVSGVKSTDIYIFKGENKSLDSFWDLKGKYGIQKALASLSDEIVYQTTLHNRISFKDASPVPELTEFNITFDETRETYTAFLKDEPMENGRYGVYFDAGKQHRFSAIHASGDHLSKSRSIGHFAKAGRSGSVFITYCTASMNENGSVDIFKTKSNSIPYTLPLY